MRARGDRDQRLGAALRELEVPEHGPEFWTALEARLAEEAEWGRPRRRRRLLSPTPRRALAAVLAAAAAVVAVVVGLPRTETPERALADVVKERVAEAIEDLRTLQGRFSYRSRIEDPPTGAVERGAGRYSFAYTSEGDFRVTRLDGDEIEDTAFRAGPGVQRSIFPSASLGFGRFYSERRGLPPGPPDLGPAEFVLERELGPVVRALLAAEDPRVEETTHRGRPAWRVRLQVEPNLIFADYDRIDAIVDQDTGLPLRVRKTLAKELHSELRVSELEVNRPLPDDAFRIRVPAGEELARSDEGFRRVELDEVAEIVGYEPLLPEALPDGFSLAEVAVARRAAPTGPEAGNPPSRRVVSLSYRRGFEQAIVTTRLANPRPEPGELRELTWDDPFGSEGIRRDPERRRLRAGALEGAAAELALGPRTVPHLWALGEELVLTVSGDLNRDELLALAESLRPAGDEGS